MKFKKIYKFAGLIFLYVVLQSRAGGPGTAQNLQVTGAPGSTGNPGTCGNPTCHTDGDFAPALTIALKENDNPVTQYEPGKTYTLNVTLAAGNGAPSRYGFQAVALNATNQQAGDWGALGSGKHTVTLGGRKYVEHSAPAPSPSFNMEWLAPEAGTGDVKFFSAGIAANNNGVSTGDGVANSSLTIAEKIESSVDDPTREYASLKILPNPVHDAAKIAITSRKAGQFILRFADASGRVVRTENITMQIGENEYAYQVSGLAPGLYVVELCGDGHLTAVQMLKK